VQEEVVITGIGIACPLGVGREAVWSAIENRQSGVRVIERLAQANYPMPIGGEVLQLEPKQYVKPRKSLKVMSRETQLGFTAAELAWADAQLDNVPLDPERLGVVVGTNIFRSQLEDLTDLYKAACSEGDFTLGSWGPAMREMYPLWMLKYLPNMTCCHIGIAHDVRGPINTIVEGNVSSLMAIIEAADVIARGHADLVIAGGASTMLSAIDLVWHGGAEMSRNVANPAAACRPFEAARDGSATSEGAGMLILESRAHAKRRGAQLQGKILGYGRRYEPGATSQKPNGQKPNGQKPTGQAIRQAIEAALEMSRLAPSDIGHVNAHGLATLDDDTMEARAIEQTLGDVPVTAPKSFFGNLGASSGAVELAISLLGLQHNVVPPTLNYEQPDPACPVNIVHEMQPAQSSTVLALNHKRTGQAVAVAVSGQ